MFANFVVFLTGRITPKIKDEYGIPGAFEFGATWSVMGLCAALAYVWMKQYVIRHDQKSINRDDSLSLVTATTGFGSRLT